MNKKLISLLVAICLVIGLLPAVAMPHARAEGGPLEANYVLNFGYVSGVSKKYTLTNYDTAIYFKNTTLESGAIRETTTGASETDWNAKLIWHTGDEGPTLYLDGFIFDYYDEANENFMKSSVIGLNASSNGKPLTIVVQGEEDSVIKASAGGVVNNADITIRSESDAKLTTYTGVYAIRGTGTSTVNIDANLEAFVVSYSDGNRGGITSTKGDVNITGGKVDITTINDSRVRPIVVCSSGNVNISGGADVTLNNTMGGESIGAYGGATPVVTVTDASLTMYGKNNTNKAPTVGEGCYTLEQGTLSDGSNAAQTGALADGNKYYSISRNHDNLTEHPATEAQIGVAGNTAYWSCDVCGKFFADAAGKQEIAKDSWIIPALPEVSVELETPYQFGFGYVSGFANKYSLTHYDTPIYFKNTTVEKNGYTCTRETKTGASENDWNAKVIWHTGDEGPTMYLDGFIFDTYDETAGEFKVASAIAIYHNAGKPLTIVLQGEDSRIDTKAITNNADITIRSEGNTKLTGNMQYYFVRATTEGSVTINANLDVDVIGYADGKYGGITSTKGDVNITGGKVIVETRNDSRARPIVVNTSGNVNVSGGAKVTLENGAGGISVYGNNSANTTVNVKDNASLTLYGNLNPANAPVVEGSYCALKEGASADTAEVVDAFTAKKGYYAVVREHTYADGVCSVCGEAETPTGDPTDATSEPTTTPSTEATTEATTAPTTAPSTEATTEATTAPTGPALAAAYEFGFGYVSGVAKKYTLTNYDTPVYFKNTTLESGAIRETTTGASESDWNAKAIWHEGDEGPTLYLNGFIFDYYNETTEAFMASNVIALYHSGGKPLTIVLQGEDSVIKASLGAITNNAAITIRSENGAKLNGYCGVYLARATGTAGSVNINANLEATITSYSNSNRGGITSTSGDINITGGKVDITIINDSRARPIVVCSSGNVNISGGADVTLRNSAGGNSVYGYNSTPTVTVNNADLTLYGKISTNAAPVIAAGFDAYLMQGSKADGSDAEEVTAFEEGKKHYGVYRDSANAPTIPAPTTSAPTTSAPTTSAPTASGSTNPATTQPTVPIAGGPLTESYKFQFGYVGGFNNNYTLTHYDTPIYFKNTTVEKNEYMCTRETIAGASENDWNAKLIWHAGDNGPTLYLDGFVFDIYDESIDAFVVSSAIALYSKAGKPLTIVLQGEDSRIDAKAIANNADITIRSVGDTKLTGSMFAYFMRSMAGSVTINANLDVYVIGYADSKYGGITSTNGDVNFTGGVVKVKTDVDDERARPVVVNTSGNVNVSGGAKVTLENGAGGYSVYGKSASPVVTVNNAELTLHGKISTNVAPVVAEGFNAYLMQGSEAGGYDGVMVEAFEDGKKFYVVSFTPVTAPIKPTIAPGSDPAAPATEPTADPTAAPGKKLPKPVSIKVGSVQMQITKYDTPVYVVNTPVEVKDTEGNLFQAMVPAITTEENNWNAKFVWNSNEGIPTLYIDGLIVDSYNEETSLWRGSPSKPASVLGVTGIEVSKGRYVRVLATGEDSLFKTTTGIIFNSKLRLETEGDTKIDFQLRTSGIRGATGMPLVVNANINVSLQSSSDGRVSHMLITNNADLTINGGTIKLEPGAERITAIYANGGGNVTINGGNITAKGTWGTGGPNGTIKSSHGKVTINDGTLNITAAHATGIYGLTGIDINGGIVNITSPSYGIIAGTKKENATININGGTITIVAQKVSNNTMSAIVTGSGVYGYAGAGPRSAEAYTGDAKARAKLIQKPWMFFTDDENKKIDLEPDYEEEDDIITESTEAPTESTAPSASNPSADPTATDGTIPEATTPVETTPEDEFYEDEEYDDGYYDYGITPNLNITEGINEEIPDALIEMGIDSVDKIREVLVEMVWAVDDYSDMFAFFDITLMYFDGEDWVVADEEHYPEDGYITAMLPYPEGTGMDTPFTAVHMYDSDAFGLTPGEVELLTPINTEDGILLELTGLSPVAIAWEGLAEDNFETGDTGVGLYIGLMVVAVLGMAGTVMLSNNKKKRKA